jgi:multidrug transporter EmrE-like cation transporter
MAWLGVAAAVFLGAYGQLVVKWQVMRRGHLPPSVHGKLMFFVNMLLDPWVISVMVATLVAALAWMAALSRLDLSRAYPFVSLSFVTVLVLSAVFFGESLTLGKVAGITLVIAGLVVGVTL